MAFLVFFAGSYGFLDPNWPPADINPIGYYIIIAEDVYMVIAGIVIVTALIIQGAALKGCEKPFLRSNNWWLAHAIAWEMFGWLFVSSATAVVAATTFVLPPTALLHGDQPVEILIFWMMLWGALSAASFIKFWNIRRSVRRRP